MPDMQQVQNNVEQYMAFLNLDNTKNIADELSGFFTNEEKQDLNKEAILDRGSLMLFRDGKLQSQIEVSGDFDENRIIKFDGQTISEINPLAYLDIHPMQMKGDSRGSRRRGGYSTGGGITCNNNNNNNNNNNG